MQTTLDFPMPIITDRLIIRPTQENDAKMLNDAIIESYEDLHHFMEWCFSFLQAFS
ncbi:MAG: hypothetical protein Q8L78_06975 [Coxiellaceae bacterium]|nr:hypothetical protein [Coxiellaceae bacterium]